MSDRYTIETDSLIRAEVYLGIAQLLQASNTHGELSEFMAYMPGESLSWILAVYEEVIDNIEEPDLVGYLPDYMGNSAVIQWKAIQSAMRRFVRSLDLMLGETGDE